MSDSLWEMANKANAYDFDNVPAGVCKRCCHTHAPEWPCVLDGLQRHVAYRLDKERSLTARLAEAQAQAEAMTNGLVQSSAKRLDLEQRLAAAEAREQDMAEKYVVERDDLRSENDSLRQRWRRAEAALAVAEATCGQWMQDYCSVTKEEKEVDNERMAKWFAFEHLPEDLKIVSIKFYELACSLCALVEPGPERTVALRKLLEAKDAAVRAKLSPGG